MKKMLLILALAIVSFANAQKGTILVGGNVVYNSEKIDREISSVKTDAFAFSPKVGYQFHDNWTAGTEFSLESSKTNSGDVEGKYTAYRVGAFVRYTMPLNETFSVFADLDAGFKNQKSKGYENGLLSYTHKGNGFYTGITPALFINMKKGFGLNFSIGGLGYETLNYDNGIEDVDNRKFSFNFGKTVNIGVSKNF